jgi:hypothetical protein
MRGRLLLVVCAASIIVSGCAGAPTLDWDGQGRAAARRPGSTTTTSVAPGAPTTTTTAPSPGAPVTVSCDEGTDSYTRPYANTAAWNVPVCGLDADPRSDDWRDRFWYYSRFNANMATNPAQGTFGKHDVMFGLDADPNRDFSVSVVDARDATTTIRVFQRSGWHGKFNIPKASTMPWNPTWRASSGSDAMLIVLDPSNGSQWSLWGVAQSYYGLPANDTQCWGDLWSVWLPGGGFKPGVDLCVGGADRVKEAGSTTQLADYRTYAGNNPETRGVGIDRYAMLVTPQEVATGQIRHALNMPVYNTMSGEVVCTEAQGKTTAMGSTCGQAVAPAGNFERWGSATKGCSEPVTAQLSNVDYRKTTLPSGTRFALRKTPAEIEQWLDSRGYTGAKRSTARAFATALVNYGWFITDSTCSAANFQVAGGGNPETAAAWRVLGITGDGRDLLDGLITRDRVWTVERPVNHCTTGNDSELACPAKSSSYR